MEPRAKQKGKNNRKKSVPGSMESQIISEQWPCSKKKQRKQIKKTRSEETGKYKKLEGENTTNKQEKTRNRAMTINIEDT